MRPSQRFFKKIIFFVEGRGKPSAKNFLKKNISLPRAGPRQRSCQRCWCRDGCFSLPSAR
jgi:hypothetical protein